VRAQEVIFAIFAAFVSIFLVSPAIQPRWPAPVKAFVRFCVPVFFFCLLGLYFVWKGENLPDTLAKWIFCPLYHFEACERQAANAEDSLSEAQFKVADFLVSPMGYGLVQIGMPIGDAYKSLGLRDYTIADVTGHTDDLSSCFIIEPLKGKLGHRVHQQEGGEPVLWTSDQGGCAGAAAVAAGFPGCLRAGLAIRRGVG
jgi:hypothetical protein